MPNDDNGEDVIDVEVVAEDELGELPSTSKAAKLGVTAVGTALGYIPMAGPPVAALWNYLLAPSLDKRKDKWLGILGEVVQELHERMEGFDPRGLDGNEQFVSAVLAASTIAVKTHHEEKLEMLRNALVNSVLPGAPDEHEQMTFLRFVDELTPLEVRMLAFLADPRGWFDRHDLEKPQFTHAGVFHVAQIGLPELRERQDLFDQLARNLDQRGLVGGGGLHGTMTADGVWSGRAQPLGRRFLDFITLDEPIT